MFHNQHLQNIQNIQTWGLALVCVMGCGMNLMARPAQAQIALPSSLATDLQSPTNAQRFFSRGRQHLEQEIAWLSEQQFTPAVPILRLSQELQRIQTELQRQELRPGLRRELELRLLEPEPSNLEPPLF